MEEPFDAFEARRLIEEARAVEDEFVDLPGWGLRVDESREERRVLEDLRDRLVKAADEAVKPVAKIHNDTRALVEAWGSEREWDPAFRQKQRKAG